MSLAGIVVASWSLTQEVTVRALLMTNSFCPWIRLIQWKQLGKIPLGQFWTWRLAYSNALILDQWICFKPHLIITWHVLVFKLAFVHAPLDFFDFHESTRAERDEVRILKSQNYN